MKRTQATAMQPFELTCPTCGCAGTHQFAATAYWRDADESAHGIVATSARKSGWLARGDMEHNPSLRRDGVVIAFECEGCQHAFALVIVQHKGTSYVSMQPELPARSPWLQEGEPIA
jgi:hypothetical protein